jgi:hypothetical protein
VGFTVDVVEYSSRTIDAQQQIQNRLIAIWPVSDTRYQDVIIRFAALAMLPFEHVVVEVKDYRARAHLLVCN